MGMTLRRNNIEIDKTLNPVASNSKPTVGN
jgi:hypothetical protein